MSVEATARAVCPRCDQVAEAEIDAARDALDGALYGKVSEQEYLAAQAASSRVVRLLPSMFVKSVISIHGDEISVFWDCVCDECGFKHKFRHKENMEL